MTRKKGEVGKRVGDGLVGFLVGCLVGCLVDSLVGCLVGRMSVIVSVLTGALVGGLNGVFNGVDSWNLHFRFLRYLPTPLTQSPCFFAGRAYAWRLCWTDAIVPMPSI